jgi:DNA repair exonuclease SbcCD ATPase subunit
LSEPEEMDRTQAVINKLTPRLIAVLVIAAIIALTAVLSYAVYKNKSVSFWGVAIGENENNDGSPNQIAELNAKISGLETNKDSLDQQVAELNAKISGLETNKVSLDQQVEELNKRSREFKSLVDDFPFDLKSFVDDSKENFPLKLSLLEYKIYKLDKSINPTRDNKKIKVIYKIIQDVFKEIGSYQHSIDGKPISTHLAIKTYQEDYNEKYREEGEDDYFPDHQLGYFGLKTVDSLRRIYLSRK